MPQTTIAVYMPIHDGTWKYMIFWISPIVDSYGACAMKYGAEANSTATTATSGAKAFRMAYSVINGSKVQSASVTKTTSNAARMPIHIVAAASSGVAAKSAAVPRTPAMITGIVIGYNRIGNSTSRDRARTSIAANSVPTAANPIRPPATDA